MKETRLRSAANTQLEMKDFIRQDAQLRQRTAKPSFLMVTDLATDMILETAYTNENIERICLKKGTLNFTGSSLVALWESVSNTAYMADNVRSMHGHSESELNKHPCTTVCQKNVPPMSEAYLHVRSITQSVQLATSHKDLVKNRRALVAQGIAKVVTTKPFIIKMPNW